MAARKQTTPKPDFTFEEWAGFLVENKKLDADGFTVSEFASISGKSKRWIQERIAESKGSDNPIRCVGRRTQERIDGTPHHVPVYVFPQRG